MKLTTREYVLLFVLGFLLVNYLGINFLIQPLDTKINSLEADNDALQIDYDTKYMLAENYVRIQSNFLVSQQTVKDNKEQYLPYKEISAINQYVEQNLLTNIKVNSLSIMYDSIEGLEIGTYINAVHIVVQSDDTLGNVMDTIDLIQTSEYKTYIKSFTVSEKSSSIDFYMFVGN